MPLSLKARWRQLLAKRLDSRKRSERAVSEMAAAAAKSHTALADGDSWSITESHRQLLRAMICDRRRRNVLEFGAGASSVCIAEALSKSGGGRLTSIEQNPLWCRRAWRQVTQIPDVDCQLLVAKPRFRVTAMGISFTFRHLRQQLRLRAPYDFVAIDGPQYYFGRNGTLPAVFDLLSSDAICVLDDVCRYSERYMLCEWLSLLSGLELTFDDPAFAGTGVAVLSAKGKLQQRFDLLGYAVNLWHSGRLILNNDYRSKRRSQGAGGCE